jgi:hypothetical protein
MGPREASAGLRMGRFQFASKHSTVDIYLMARARSGGESPDRVSEIR